MMFGATRDADQRTRTLIGAAIGSTCHPPMVCFASATAGVPVPYILTSDPALQSSNVTSTSIYWQGMITTPSSVPMTGAVPLIEAIGSHRSRYTASTLKSGTGTPGTLMPVPNM